MKYSNSWAYRGHSHPNHPNDYIGKFFEHHKCQYFPSINYNVQYICKYILIFSKLYYIVSLCVCICVKMENFMNFVRKIIEFQGSHR